MKKLAIVLCSFFLLSATALAVGIKDLHIPSTMTVGKHKLILNGVGFRKKFFFKIYAGALYLGKKETDPQKIINAEEPMAVKMVFVYHEVSSKKLQKTWNEGFEKVLGDKISGMQKKITAFNAIFTEAAKKGDVYDIVYTPEEGIKVYMNGKLKGTIPGLDFKKALFAIWLGDKPADSGLKKKMLGE